MSTLDFIPVLLEALTRKIVSPTRRQRPIATDFPRQKNSRDESGLLVPAAEALADDHPLAASVLYRALLDDILARAKSPAYGHGAKYLGHLDRLAQQVTDWQSLPDHVRYREQIKKDHGRKLGFWSLVK